MSIKPCVIQAVSEWSGVAEAEISASTVLNGLGGKSYPADGQALATLVEQKSGLSCSIPAEDWGIWAAVEDIDEYIDPR